MRQHHRHPQILPDRAVVQAYQQDRLIHQQHTQNSFKPGKQARIHCRAGAIHALLRSPEQLAAERAQHAEKRRALGQPTQVLNPASPLGIGSGGYASPGSFFHGLNVSR
jgi:hypothetical protein